MTNLNSRSMAGMRYWSRGIVPQELMPPTPICLRSKLTYVVPRNSAAVVGRYVQSVNDQYHYGYVRTQESGTKTGLRYFRLLDSNGTGLEVTADERFSASALPFSMRDLDCLENGTPKRANKTNTQNGEARHSLNLKAKAHGG